MNDEAVHTLKRYWGYDRFRPGQDLVIGAVLDRRDVLALLPTGGGKSLCFQVPAMIFSGITLVVSPLIALMKDQVEGLHRRGIPASAVTGHHTRREQDRFLGMARDGQLKLLYVSPEKLASQDFREWLSHLQVDLLVVDEAHCISQWGYDFRPEYLNIHQTRELLPGTPCIALTASATPAVAADIIEQLRLQEPFRYSAGFDKPNLDFSVHRVESKPMWLRQHLGSVKSCGLVYVPTRRDTLETGQLLRDNGQLADFYHAGLAPDVRERKQEDWKQGRSRVMVCTNAFGMGVDKPDVRFVVHTRVPMSPEALYQEAGRAGRDGKKAVAGILWYETDRQKLQEQIDDAFPPVETVQRVYKALMSHFSLPVGAGEGRFFPFDAALFCKAFGIEQKTLHHALGILELNGLLKTSESVRIPARIRVLCSYADLYEYKLEHIQYDALINALLRLYPGVFDHYVGLREQKLALMMAQPETIVKEQLKALNRAEVMDYIPLRDKPGISLLQDHQQPLRLNLVLMEKIKQNRQAALNAVLEFVDTTECRLQYLRHYFGETDAAACGHCDNCRGKTPEPSSGIDKTQLALVLDQGPASAAQLMQAFGFTDPESFRMAMSECLDSGVITMNSKGWFEWASA